MSVETKGPGTADGAEFSGKQLADELTSTKEDAQDKSGSSDRARDVRNSQRVASSCATVTPGEIMGGGPNRQAEDPRDVHNEAMARASRAPEDLRPADLLGGGSDGRPAWDFKGWGELDGGTPKAVEDDHTEDTEIISRLEKTQDADDIRQSLVEAARAGYLEPGDVEVPGANGKVVKRRMMVPTGEEGQAVLDAARDAHDRINHKMDHDPTVKNRVRAEREAAGQAEPDRTERSSDAVPPDSDEKANEDPVWRAALNESSGRGTPPAVPEVAASTSVGDRKVSGDEGVNDRVDSWAAVLNEGPGEASVPVRVTPEAVSPAARPPRTAPEVPAEAPPAPKPVVARDSSGRPLAWSPGAAPVEGPVSTTAAPASSEAPRPRTGRRRVSPEEGDAVMAQIVAALNERVNNDNLDSAPEIPPAPGKPVETKTPAAEAKSPITDTSLPIRRPRTAEAQPAPTPAPVEARGRASVDTRTRVVPERGSAEAKAFLAQVSGAANASEVMAVITAMDAAGMINGDLSPNNPGAEEILYNSRGKLEEFPRSSATELLMQRLDIALQKPAEKRAAAREKTKPRNEEELKQAAKQAELVRQSREQIARLGTSERHKEAAWEAALGEDREAAAQAALSESYNQKIDAIPGDRMLQRKLRESRDEAVRAEKQRQQELTEQTAETMSEIIKGAHAGEEATYIVDPGMDNYVEQAYMLRNALNLPPIPTAQHRRNGVVEAYYRPDHRVGLENVLVLERYDERSGALLSQITMTLEEEPDTDRRGRIRLPEGLREHVNEQRADDTETLRNQPRPRHNLRGNMAHVYEGYGADRHQVNLARRRFEYQSHWLRRGARRVGRFLRVR